MPTLNQRWFSVAKVDNRCQLRSNVESTSENRRRRNSLARVADAHEVRKCYICSNISAGFLSTSFMSNFLMFKNFIFQAFYSEICTKILTSYGYETFQTEVYSARSLKLWKAGFGTLKSRIFVDTLSKFVCFTFIPYISIYDSDTLKTYLLSRNLPRCICYW